MSKKEDTKTEGKAVAPESSKWSIVWLVVPPLIAVLLVFVYWFVFQRNADLAPERIESALASAGSCTPRQAQELDSQAANIEEVAERAQTYELAMNCYLGHEDYVSAQQSAINAEEYYNQAGMPQQAQQMNAAQQAHQLIIDYQDGIVPAVPRDDESEVDGGDVI